MLETLAEQIKEFGKLIETFTTRVNYSVETYDMDKETYAIIVYNPLGKIVEVRYDPKDII